MGSKPSSQSNTSSTSGPSPMIQADYNQVISQAQSAASTPYQAFGGELVAPVNSQQSTGISGINAAQGVQNPYNAGAAASTVSGAQQIDPTQYSGAAIGQFQSPYTSDVVNTTLAAINNQNAQQNAGLLGNAITSGNAFGGDRAGIAQAAQTGQQNIATDQTIASLENQGFQNAQSEFNNQQQTGLAAAQNTASRQLQAGSQLGQLGQTAQTEALTGANAQINAGTLQQQTSQAQDTAAYNQFLQKQAYPFQTTGWLANIVQGIGSQSGGTTTGQTTQQSGNGVSTALGAATALGSLFLALGGRVGGGHSYANGGRAFANGGGLGGAISQGLDNPTSAVPTGLGGGSWVPQSGGLSVGNTMPKATTAAPGAAASSSPSMAGMAQGVSGLGNALFGGGNGSASTAGATVAGIAGGLGPEDFQLGPGSFRRGGPVGLAAARYRDGGTVLGDGGLMRRGYDSGGAPDPLAAVYSDPLDYGAITVAQQPPPASVSPTGGAGLAGAAPVPTMGNAPGISEDMGAYARTVPAGLGAAMPSGAVPSIDFSNAPSPDPAVDQTRTPMVPPGAGTPLPGTGYNAPIGVAAADTSNPVSAIDAATAPRGLRNNNPGNLIDNSYTQGMPGYVGTDGRFAKFATPEAGAAALDKNLQSYASQGVSTPLQIASKWAPAGDGANDPVAYAGTIAKQLGVGINDKIDLTDPATRAKIAAGISVAENGTAASLPAHALGYTDTGAATAAASPSSGAGLALAANAPPADLAPSPIDQAMGAPGSHSKGLLGLDLSDSTRMGLLAAGLGIMGGKSLNPWQNIGQGGLEGLQTMMEANKTGAQTGLTRAQTLSVQTQNEINQAKAQTMMQALRKLSSEQGAPPVSSASSPAAAGAPSPAVADGQGGANPAVNPSAPAAAPDRASAPLDPDWDPARLTRDGNLYAAAGLTELASQKFNQAKMVVDKGMARDINGNMVPLPGAQETEARGAGLKAGAESAARSAYDFQEVQPEPGGPTYWVPKSQLAEVQKSQPGANAVGVGAGSPPGAKTDAIAAAQPQVAKQPAFYGERQKQIAEDENTMTQQFQVRQLARQRLQTLQNIVQNYQPNAFAQQKADMAAKLSAVGLPAPKSWDPASFQEFQKNAIANVFNDVKGMGGRVLVSEIDGLSRANANPSMQPAAVAQILGQGMGVLDYEDQHFRDYAKWKAVNPNAVTTMPFEADWSKANPVQRYVTPATQNIGYAGQEIPAAAQRQPNQVYQTPKGQFRWTGTGWTPAGATAGAP